MKEKIMSTKTHLINSQLDIFASIKKTVHPKSKFIVELEEENGINFLDNEISTFTKATQFLDIPNTIAYDNWVQSLFL